MNRPKRLIQGLIPTYFPELIGLDIISTVVNARGQYLACYASTSPKTWFIETSPRVAVLPRPALEGGLAHELVHVSQGLKMIEKGTWEKNMKRYREKRSANEYEELITDLEVVKRGLGRELLAFAQWQLRTEGEDNWNFGTCLHPKEIEEILHHRELIEKYERRLRRDYLGR